MEFPTKNQFPKEVVKSSVGKTKQMVAVNIK